MSDAPTYANLLTRWSGGGTDARQGVYAHLRTHPADAAAVEAGIRHELANGGEWTRIVAAEAMIAVYGDEPAAAAALGWVFRRGDPTAALDAIPVLRRLSPPHAALPLGELVLHAPSVFLGLAPDIQRWAASAAVLAGREGVGALQAMLTTANVASEPALMTGLADAALRTEHDLSEVEPWLRERARRAGASVAVGAALWRVTWRVDRRWLATINLWDPLLQDHTLLNLLIDVLTEHLGRRPDVARLVRELLLRLAADDLESCLPWVKRLADFGYGWSVLLPVLGVAAVPDDVRSIVFREAAARPAIWSLAQHHAHAVVLGRASNRNAVGPELLEAACELLRRMGPAAGSALPDVLNLIVKQPDTARLLAPAVRAVAPGWPLPAAAIARTLDRLCRSVVFAPDAFAALAEVYAELARDAWPALVDDTGFDPRTAAALLQQPAWADAPPDVRRADALRLADRLLSPRADVRARAADLLRHYPDRATDVWPALVALLVTADGHTVLLAVPHFRHLGEPAAGRATAELKELLGEQNPAYAARAAVALWRLGRTPVASDDLRAAVMTASGDAWGRAVLRGVAERVFPGRSPLADLSDVLAAAPAAVAAEVHTLLNPPELPEEKAIGSHVPPAAGASVYWDGVYQCVGTDSEGGLLFLALMCAHGSAGFASQKIWMIKQQRGLAGTMLADAKAVVDAAVERLTAAASKAEKAARVRDYLRWPHGGLPKPLTELLDHRLSWYRWAGLELLHAWDAAAAAPLIAERVWDRSALVRARALQAAGGAA